MEIDLYIRIKHDRFQKRNFKMEGGYQFTTLAKDSRHTGSIVGAKTAKPPFRMQRSFQSEF